MMPLLSGGNNNDDNQESRNRELESRNYAIWASMFILVVMIVFVGFILPWIKRANLMLHY
jgi:hypothetical protein